MINIYMRNTEKIDRNMRDSIKTRQYVDRGAREIKERRRRRKLNPKAMTVRAFWSLYKAADFQREQLTSFIVCYLQTYEHKKY